MIGSPHTHIKINLLKRKIMIKYPYLGKHYVNGKPYVVLFLEEETGVVLVDETDGDSIQFGQYGHFDENEFELLPPDEVVRISN